MKDLRLGVVEEFAVSQRVVRAGIDVVPRFKIFAPARRLHPASEDIRDRIERLEVMRNFMIWKAASGSVLASEIEQPELALMVVVVTRFDLLGALQPITRKPASFDTLRWLGRDMIGDNILDLLPPKSLSITHQELEFMRRAFEEGEIERINWQQPVS